VLLTETMTAKLESLQNRFEEVAALLSDAEIMADRERFTALSKEYSEIEPVVACFQKATQLEQNISDNELILEEDDPEMRELAQQDIADCKAQLDILTDGAANAIAAQGPKRPVQCFFGNSGRHRWR
jgi:peptide chain release factor 1